MPKYVQKFYFVAFVIFVIKGDAIPYAAACVTSASASYVIDLLD